MTSAQLINQTSGDVEYYTDPKIIAAVRDLFGGVIHLDPASSNVANASIKALRYFGKELNGIAQSWSAQNLWLNHPFGRIESACSAHCERHLKNPKHRCHDFDYLGNEVWIRKLELEFQSSNFNEGCNITYAATSEAWFQPLLKRPQCYLCPRTNYYLPDGTIKKGVTKGSVVTYYGPHIQRFAECFAHLGTVKLKFP